MAYGLGNMAGGYAQGLEQTRARKDALRQQAFQNTMAQQGLALEKDRLQLERANAMNTLKLGFLEHQEAVRAHQAVEAQARADAAQRGEEFQKTHEMALKEHTLNQAKNFALIRQTNASILMAALANDRASAQFGLDYANGLLDQRIKTAQASMEEMKSSEYLDPDAKSRRQRMDELALQLAEAQGAKALFEKTISDGLAAGYTPQLIAAEFERRLGESKLPGAQVTELGARARRYDVETKEFPATARSERALQEAQTDYQRALTSKTNAMVETGDPKEIATANWMLANPNDPLTMSIVNAGALGGKTGAAKMMPNIPQLEEQERKAYKELLDAAKEDGMALTQDRETGAWLILAPDPNDPKAKTQDWFPLGQYLDDTAKKGELTGIRGAYNSYMTIVSGIVHAQNIMAGIPAGGPPETSAATPEASGALAEDAAAIERARKVASAGFPAPMAGPPGGVVPPKPGATQQPRPSLPIGTEVFKRQGSVLMGFRVKSFDERKGVYTLESFPKGFGPGIVRISRDEMNRDPRWDHPYKR